MPWRSAAVARIAPPPATAPSGPTRPKERYAASRALSDSTKSTFQVWVNRHIPLHSAKSRQLLTCGVTPWPRLPTSPECDLKGGPPPHPAPGRFQGRGGPLLPGFATDSTNGGRAESAGRWSNSPDPVRLTPRVPTAPLPAPGPHSGLGALSRRRRYSQTAWMVFGPSPPSTSGRGLFPSSSKYTGILLDESIIVGARSQRRKYSG